MGIGTTTPTSRLDVRGSVKIDSALVVKDSVRINKSLRVDQDVRLLGLTKLNETKVLMDFTVQGLSKFNGELKANSDFISQGFAKFNGDVKMTNLEQISNLANKYVLFTNENGVLQRMNVDSMMAKITIAPGSQLLANLVDLVYFEPVYCDPSGIINNPTWSNGVNKIYTYCPQIKVGIGTSEPIQKLDVRGKSYFSDYVGIGIQNPLYGLHVNESIKVNGDLHAGNAGIGRDAETFAKISIKNQSAPAALKIQSTNPNAYTKLLYMEFFEKTTEVLKVVNTGTGAVPYLFEANGTVTIKNETGPVFQLFPSGKLIVSNGTSKLLQLEPDGMLRGRRIKLDVVSWADFVFEDNYSLMKLSEVEKFIQRNKHLPNVPSEKQMKENGLDVTEMNALLLQKIEELTLYVIQQQKELEIVKEQLQVYKK